MNVDRRRFDGTQGPRLIGPADGHAVDLVTLGARFMVWSGESGGGFSLVEHPIPPRVLCAPMASATGSPDLGVRYGIEFEVESVPRLCAEHGLRFGPQHLG